MSLVLKLVLFLNITILYIVKFHIAPNIIPNNLPYMSSVCNNLTKISKQISVMIKENIVVSKNFRYCATEIFSLLLKEKFLFIKKLNTFAIKKDIIFAIKKYFAQNSKFLVNNTYIEKSIKAFIAPIIPKIKICFISGYFLIIFSIFL